MTRHMFCTIDNLFRPNNSTYRDRLNPISDKKLKKGDACWSTIKTVLGWAINTARQVLTLPQARKGNLDKSLNAISKDDHHCSKKK